MEIFSSPATSELDEKSIIKVSFKEIEKAQTRRNRSQAEDIIRYLRKKGVGERELKLTEEVLKDLERIFWAVDDTIDNEYLRTEQKLFNEIVKFFSFIRLVERILKNDGQRRGIFKRGPTAFEIIKSLEGSLHPLVEATMEDKVLTERLKRLKKVEEYTDVIVEYLLTRSRYINVYASLAEIICGTTINPKPFTYMRALEKLGREIEDMGRNRTGVNTNIVLLLRANLGDRKRTRMILEDVLDYIYGIIEVSVDENSRFLIKKAEEDEQRIRNLLKTL